MDFNDTPEEAKFRKEAYEWLKANAPLKEGPKDGWRASSEEEGLKEVWWFKRGIFCGHEAAYEIRREK